MKNKTEYCTEADKVCFSSESKAQRYVEKYSDIKRYYKCKSCGQYHLTSMSLSLAISEGLVEKPEDVKKVKKSQIEQRLQYLYAKLRLEESIKNLKF